jgi:deazaflavin-dependent oxidoreductase (nitroreductase family)
MLRSGGSIHHPRHRVRTFNKYVLNPMMRTFAGRRYWFAAAVHHNGRNSGRAYVTPVVAQRVPAGFVIPLPYGTDVDWLRNILAAGHATIDVHGRHYSLFQPQVLNMDTAFPMLPARLEHTWRRLGIEQYLRMRAEQQHPS